MKLAIMQPYFFPYIGYFQLINAVDEFIIYDNIEYTKKGWINRNRILVNGIDTLFSLPIKKDSDYLHVRERFLSNTWEKDRKKMLNQIIESYRKAPFFNETYQLVEKCIFFEDSNLFNFILHSIQLIINHLKIKTKVIISSSLPIDDKLKRNEKIIAICKQRKADIYINPIGGQKLYEKEDFQENNVKLFFQKTNNIYYTQFNNDFVPWLSIIDILMFNSPEEINFMLDQFELI